MFSLVIVLQVFALVSGQLYGVSENGFGDLVLSSVSPTGAGDILKTLVTGEGQDVPYVWGISAYDYKYNKLFTFVVEDHDPKYALYELNVASDTPIRSKTYFNKLPASLAVDTDNDILYGISRDGALTQVVQFDLKKKQMNSVFDIGTDRPLVAVGIATFEVGRQIYYYITSDFSGTSYLMGIDIPNTVIRHQFPIEGRFFSIRWDQVSNQLYGLQSANGTTRLVTIDVNTGLIHPVNIPNIAGGYPRFFTSELSDSKFTFIRQKEAPSSTEELVTVDLLLLQSQSANIPARTFTTLVTSVAPVLFDKDSTNSKTNLIIILCTILGFSFIAGVTIGIFFIIKKRKRSPSQPDHNKEHGTTTDYNSVAEVQLVNMDPPGNRSSVNLPPGSRQSTTALIDTQYKKIPERNDLRAIGNRSDNQSRSEMIVRYSDLVLEKEIGKGAYGVVYVGKWRNSKVAIKMLRTDAFEENAMRAFQDEAALMMRLRPHMNVVLLLGITFTPDPLCIITEYVENGSLYDYLSSNAIIPMTVKIKFMKGVASGVLHLHQEGIVHRDLAARNVLLTASMEPKITDFGMSRQSTSDNNSTKSDTGPLKWMAPESINERVYSWATDSWSYGVTCWEILARKIPYEDLDPVQAASRVCFQGLRLEVPPNTPIPIQELINQCFEVEPVRRPNFKDICDRLEAF